MSKTILFVDDEKQILKALRRLFMQKDYTCFFAESAEAALETLRNHHIDLIVTDIKMPTMDGYRLLKLVKEKYPTTLRACFSGYSDEGLILKTLEDNLAELYLFKPWDNKKLTTTIENILEKENKATIKSGSYSFKYNGSFVCAATCV